MKLVFLHIPKAGGTSVRLNLERALQKDKVSSINAYNHLGIHPSTFPDDELPDNWLFEPTSIRYY